MTRQDVQLAIRVMARASGAGAGDVQDDERALEARLADEGLDAVLDDPRLPAALLREPLGALASLRLLTYVMIRSALVCVGEDDHVIGDYAAALVLAFGARGRAQRSDESDDELFDTLAELLRTAEGSDERRAFLGRAHLGNYALWLSGLFPDYIEHRRWRRGGPHLEYYEEMGKRGFTMAAEHPAARRRGMADLYAAMADRFCTLRVALTLFSDRLLFPAVQSPERLMRQVRDETHWRWTH